MKRESAPETALTVGSWLWPWIRGTFMRPDDGESFVLHVSIGDERPWSEMEIMTDPGHLSRARRAEQKSKRARRS